MISTTKMVVLKRFGLIHGNMIYKIMVIGPRYLITSDGRFPIYPSGVLKKFDIVSQKIVCSLPIYLGSMGIRSIAC